jgi:hypothetical protein
MLFAAQTVRTSCLRRVLYTQEAIRGQVLNAAHKHHVDPCARPAPNELLYHSNDHTGRMQSKVDAAVWAALGDFKLRELRLSVGPVHLHGSLGPCATHRGMATEAPVELSSTNIQSQPISLPAAHDQAPGVNSALAMPIPVTAYLANTVEALKSVGCEVYLTEVSNPAC